MKLTNLKQSSNVEYAYNAEENNPELERFSKLDKAEKRLNLELINDLERNEKEVEDLRMKKKELDGLKGNDEIIRKIIKREIDFLKRSIASHWWQYIEKFNRLNKVREELARYN